MAVIVDELTLKVTGNLVKKFDGTTSLLRVTRDQLFELDKAVQEGLQLFADTEPSPPESPKTSESSISSKQTGIQTTT